MKNIFSSWPASLSRYRDKTLFLFDFDGTLSALAPTPEKAFLPSSTHSLLKKLLRKNPGHIGVISGRQLRNVKKKLKLPNVWLAGNHGLEIEKGFKKFVHGKAVRYRQYLREIVRNLKTNSLPKGARIEDKDLSLSIHFRGVKENLIKSFKRRVFEAAGAYINNKKLHIRDGKKVWEIRPLVNWNKGDAVKFIVKASKFKGLLFYIGDDTTDEDAFRVVKRKGVAVRVGKRRSSQAGYYIRSQKDINKLLKVLNG